jgi:hypothetical protein
MNGNYKEAELQQCQNKNTKHGNERHMTTKTRSGNKFTLLNDQQKIWTRY